MASIRVTRGKEFMNRWRKYGIYIDGVKVGELDKNGTVDFPVSEGAHTLYAKIDWCYSPEQTFTAGPTGISYFTVATSQLTHVSFVIMLVIVILHRLVGRMYGDMADYCMMGLVGLCILFALVINRRHYLSLTKVDSGSDYAPPPAITGM